MTSMAILISGRGSNMEAILKAVRRKKIAVRPAVVISSRRGAPGLAAAQRLGVPVEVVEPKDEETRRTYDRRVMSTLGEYGVTPADGLVCLAGFMRLLGREFVRTYRNRILNIHPALLPSFPGLGAQRQALEYGVRYSGCTVHIVDEGTDTGPIVLQAVVPVRPNDTAESLSRRILKEEHRIYPEAVSMFARGKISADA